MPEVFCPGKHGWKSRIFDKAVAEDPDAHALFRRVFSAINKTADPDWQLLLLSRLYGC